MHILWIATKSPWPPTDGGRVVAANTIAALIEAGARVTVVIPTHSFAETSGQATATRAEAFDGRLRGETVAAGPTPVLIAGLKGLLSGLPATIERHRLAAVRERVTSLLETETIDVVHVEQIHALAQAEPAREAGVPVVLRTHNVESDLWRMAADLGTESAVERWFLLREAKRLAAFEAEAVSSVNAAIALTEGDAERLGALAGEPGSVRSIEAPYGAEAGQGAGVLDGSPALTLLGGGWLPNRDSTRWFLERAWGTVQARLPAARLHVFGGDRSEMPTHSGLTWHESPSKSRDAFPRGSILLVPLRIASGVRIKILEAWSRGIPVVATPLAVAGLNAIDGENVLIAEGDAEWGDAIARIVEQPGLGEGLVSGGRRALRQHHDPQSIAERLIAVYRTVGRDHGAPS